MSCTRKIIMFYSDGSTLCGFVNDQTGAIVKSGPCWSLQDSPPIECKLTDPGSISFTSTPSGAKIFLDGIDQGITTPNTISSVSVGTHTYGLMLAGYNDYTGSVSVAPGQTIAVSAPLTPTYREAALVSCSFPANAIAGQTYQATITVNQGSMTENYKLVFSGDLAGESTPFTVNAGTGQQQITVGSMVFTTGGPKTVTAALVKI